MSLLEAPLLPVERMSQADLIAEAGLIDELMSSYDDDQLVQLQFVWEFWRRPDQALPTGEWDIWMVIAGRGYGKTRVGAESVRHLVTEAESHGRVAVVAPTAGDGRDVMIEGESGLLAVHPRDTRPKYEPSKRRLTWPNGATGTIFSAEEPERLRGPQHDLVWGDEPASKNWQKEVGGAKAIDNIRFGLRLGKPKLILTGTPKPVPWIKELAGEAGTVVTRGATYDNLRNLAPAFIKLMLGRYEGTRLGRQELWAEFLDDVEGALWTQDVIARTRMDVFDPDQPWKSLNGWLAERGSPLVLGKRRPWRRIVAVDPPGSTAECGIVVGTAPERGVAGRDHAVILADETVSGPPEHWGAAVVRAYRTHRCSAVYVEDNQGGDMVRAVIHAVDRSIPVRRIHAVDNKKARAEPVSALYEANGDDGWVHHAGYFTLLEDQMMTWVADETPQSPDRMDAVVHVVRELLKVTSVAKVKIADPTKG